MKIDGIDVKSDALRLPFKDEVFDEIYASHIIEHFDFIKGFDVLSEWRRVLKTGGKLTVETPDFLGLCRRFINESEEGRVNLYAHIFGNPWSPTNMHKFLYTASQLKWTLDQVSFKNVVTVEALRYPGGSDINLKMEAIK
jgi:predicted SAM-dependent methyltransferase